MKKAYLTLDPPREPDGTLCRTGLRRTAPVVLLPGDPQRSRKMAALFAEASFMAHRGTPGCGKWDITVCSTVEMFRKSLISRRKHLQNSRK